MQKYFFRYLCSFVVLSTTLMNQAIAICNSGEKVKVIIPCTYSGQHFQSPLNSPLSCNYIAPKGFYIEESDPGKPNGLGVRLFIRKTELPTDNEKRKIGSTLAKEIVTLLTNDLTEPALSESYVLTSLLTSDYNLSLAKSIELTMTIDPPDTLCLLKGIGSCPHGFFPSEFTATLVCLPDE